MEMSYLRGACGKTRQEGESNEKAYERCSKGAYANGVLWSGGMSEKKDTEVVWPY